MKKNLLIALVLFAAQLFGQDPWSGLTKPTQGQSFNNSRKSNFSGFIGSNELAIFTVDYLSINRKKQELNLSRFHKSDLQLISTVNLFTVIDENFYNEPYEIFYQKNTIFLFSTLTGIKDKFNLIYLETFDEFGEKLSGRILDTIGVEETYKVKESVEKIGFIVASNDRLDPSYDQSISLTAIDSLGKTTWKTNLKSPNSQQSLLIKEIQYSTNAPLYLLCDYGFDPNVVVNMNNNPTELIKNKYALWAYDPSLNFLKEFDIRLKNKWINGITMNFNSTKELILTGFINETRNQAINGVFTLLITPQLTVKSSNYYKYKRLFFEKFFDEKKIEKAEELDDIILRNAVMLENNSFFLLGEHYYQYTERNYDPRTNITTTTENYNYNSIIVAYFDENGNHLWTDRVPKFQHSINDYGYYSSFTFGANQNNLYLFFNDTDRNNQLQLNDYFNYNSLSQNRRSQISFVHFTTEGIKARGPLVDAENSYMLCATQSQQIDSTNLYFWTENGKSAKIVSTQIKPTNN